MAENVNPRKALKDLSVIRQTIDRSTGSDFFTDFYYSMGLLMAAFGLMLAVGSGATWYLLTRQILAPSTTKLIVAMWVVLAVVGGATKISIFWKRGQKHGMDFFTYVKKVASKSFFDADLPLELAGCILMAFFIKLGHWNYILPTVSLILGMFMTSLGTLFVEKSFKRWGYLYICMGGVGYFFFTNATLLFLSILGLTFIVWGFYMRRRSAELETELDLHQEPNDTDE